MQLFSSKFQCTCRLFILIFEKKIVFHVFLVVKEEVGFIYWPNKRVVDVTLPICSFGILLRVSSLRRNTTQALVKTPAAIFVK